MLKRLVCLQPGVASVDASFLQMAPHGVSLYIRDYPELVSMRFGDARWCFSNSILCGWVSAHDRLLHLNPKDDYKFKQGDRQIFLSNTGNPQHNTRLVYHITITCALLSSSTDSAVACLWHPVWLGRCR